MKWHRRTQWRIVALATLSAVLVLARAFTQGPGTAAVAVVTAAAGVAFYVWAAPAVGATYHTVWAAVGHAALFPGAVRLNGLLVVLAAIAALWAFVTSDIHVDVPVVGGVGGLAATVVTAL